MPAQKDEHIDRPTPFTYEGAPADDTALIADNGGYSHLKPALEEFGDLYFRNGEDSDGNPNDPANPNSRAYNPELEPSDEPEVDRFNEEQAPNLEQVADRQPDSEKPQSER